MHIQFLMNSEHLFLYLFICIGLVKRLSTGCLRDDIVEHFYYTSESVAEQPMHHESDVQTEFLIIGRKVSWMEAKMLCPSYDEQPPQVSSHDPGAASESPTKAKRHSKGSSRMPNSTLATFTDEEQANWLARMLSESNYRYEGLWIGGSRKNKTSSWDWISDTKLKNSRVPKNILLESYPSWYHTSKEVMSQQNCLLFNRIGHDIPVYVPENCQLRRPFICMRDVKKKLEDKISEGASVSVDGYRYTLYNVIDYDDVHNVNSGTQKLNGGGITWKDARIECKKRGKQLAMVMTNEAATAIADVMLRNRPSMENVWLGGWSLDGTDWIWVPTGTSLSVMKSRSTQYPPWLEGHPIVTSKNNYYYQSTSRCLILDRHLCPEQVAPVFLDLDCEKERPFICQDDFDDLQNEQSIRNLARRSTIDNEEFEFSEEIMTYEEAEDYCINRDGQIANILNSKILSVCLEKMSELAIDHVWVGGRTAKINGEWHWVDSTGKTLSPKGVGSGNAWCLGDSNNELPKAEPNSCLNLDYEARGYPLFYGLPCNTTQLVLCSAPFNVSDDQVVEVHSDEVDTRLFGDLGAPMKYANRALNAIKDVTMKGSLQISKTLTAKNIKKNKANNTESKPTEQNTAEPAKDQNPAKPTNAANETSSNPANEASPNPASEQSNAQPANSTTPPVDDSVQGKSGDAPAPAAPAPNAAAEPANAPDTATTPKPDDSTQPPPENTTPK